MILNLILTYALSSNVPLYIREMGPPYRDMGVRLELHKPLPYDLFFDLEPYLWRAKENLPKSGGAIARFGWMGKHLGFRIVHESRHDFDRETRIKNIEWDAVEIVWRLN